MTDILFTEYMVYRIRQRRYLRDRIETILRYGSERYCDNETGRKIAVGTHEGRLVLIPYEETETSIVPVTVHATTRQQIRSRLMTSRFIHE